jgi:SAM-dependent methyltransferase
MSVETFRFAGEDYEYVDTVWSKDNERRAEMALVRPLLLSAWWFDKNVLEIGNVSAHHFESDVARTSLAVSDRFRVVDKYERAPGVENMDVLEVKAPAGYDLIFSVSTLEHVGWDESPRDELKAWRAIWHLGTLLRERGLLFFTIPMGYHPRLDEAIRSGGFPGERRFLRRIDAANHWEEIEAGAVGSVAYNAPFPCANVLAVCSIWKS